MSALQHQEQSLFAVGHHCIDRSSTCGIGALSPVEEQTAMLLQSQRLLMLGHSWGAQGFHACMLGLLYEIQVCCCNTRHHVVACRLAR